jgi:hypothetical protein
LARAKPRVTHPESQRRHIDALVGGEIGWNLIATHARDVFQVVLSIQAGRTTPSVLLRKLGTYNRRSLLYRAFREIGRVERTLFLLRFIADTEIRRTIRAETTKIETFNDFLDWVSFGGPVVRSGDPVEQEKQLKSASLVANAVMLSNVVDMTAVLSAMDDDGHPVTPALAANRPSAGLWVIFARILNRPREVRRHQDAPPYQRTDADQPDFDLRTASASTKASGEGATATGSFSRRFIRPGYRLPAQPFQGTPGILMLSSSRGCAGPSPRAAPGVCSPGR